MKPKQLLILAIAAVILGFLAYKMNASDEDAWGGQAKAEEDARLLPETDFDPSAVAAMTITRNGQSLTLARKDDQWQVAERFGYPANLTNLKNLLVTLTDCKVARKLQLSDTQKTDMKLTPDAGAVTLTLADASGKTLKTLAFGTVHTRETDPAAAPQNMMMMGNAGPMPDGRYIMDGDQPVLVAESFQSLDSEVPFWLDKEFFKIGELKSATLKDGDQTLWTVARADQNADLAFANATIPDTKELDSSKLSSLKSAFSWIHFNDVADPAAKPETLGLNKAKTYTATDFDGFTFTLAFGSAVNGKRYLKLNSVTWNGPAERTPGKDEKPEDKAKLDAEYAKKIKENQERAATYTKNLVPWTYEVSSYSIDNVDRKFDDFLKDKPKPEPKAETPAPAAPAK